MADDGKETGLRWWMRYIVVPVIVALIGGGGIIAIVSSLKEKPAPPPVKKSDTSSDSLKLATPPPPPPVKSEEKRVRVPAKKTPASAPQTEMKMTDSTAPKPTEISDSDVDVTLRSVSVIAQGPDARSLKLFLSAGQSFTLKWNINTRDIKHPLTLSFGSAIRGDQTWSIGPTGERTFLCDRGRETVSLWIIEDLGVKSDTGASNKINLLAAGEIECQ